MSHLEFHQHAFLDSNNVVILVAVFDTLAHDHQLLEDVKNANNASKIICCCKYGICGIGDTWDENTNSWIHPVVEFLID